MTEKRFIPIFDGTDKRVVGAIDNGKIISFMDMFDLLNNLSEENEKLKKEKQYFLKVIFAMGNYAEKGDYERIINARDKVKQRILND